MTPDRQWELWERIILLHAHVKELLIQGEELDRRAATFLQPVLEQRSALDHILRAQAAETGLGGDGQDDYAERNLDKAVGHLYRAFFDVADWVSIRLREMITIVLAPYSNECISTVIPAYYTSIRPEIEQITLDIAGFRIAKDIASHDILREVEEYHEKIRRLIDFHKTLSTSVPALVEYASREGKRTTRDHAFRIAIAILGAVVAFGLGLLARHLF